MTVLRRVTVGAGRLHLQLRHRADALEPARLAMVRHLSSGGASAATVYRCELVLEELLLNSVRHAAPGPPDATVDLRVGITPAGVVLRFEDAGAPFDPTLQPDPPRPPSIGQAQPGGLGLRLVRRLTQQLHYRRDGARNIVEVHVVHDTAPPGRA